MITKRNTFLLIFLSLLGATLLVAFSGITKDTLLSPMLFTGLGGGVSLNMYFLLTAVLLVPLAYAAMSVYSISEGRLVPELAFAAILAYPLVVYFVGEYIPAIVFGIGMTLSVFAAAHYSLKEKELYKQIHIPSITRSATAKAVMLLNLAAAFAVFFTLFSSPAYTNSQVDAMLKDIAGMGISDIGNITQAAMEQQRQASYAWIENIEASVQVAVSQNLDGMTTDQQAACQNALDARLAEIDSAAKKEIDARIAGEAIESPVDMKYLETLLSILLNWYPAIMAVTLFAVLEFFRAFLVTPLAGAYAWVIERAMYAFDSRKASRDHDEVPI